MPVVRGCNLPDDLLYDVENNLWYRDNGDETFTVGMTMICSPTTCRGFIRLPSGCQ